MVVMLEDIETRVRNVEQRVDNIEKNYGQKIAVIENSINEMQEGINDINKNLHDIKTILAKQAVVNEYMRDIYVTKDDFRKFAEDTNEKIVRLKARLDTAEQTSRSFWEKYGYVISTIAVLISIIALFLRGG